MLEEENDAPETLGPLPSSPGGAVLMPFSLREGVHAEEEVVASKQDWGLESSGSGHAIPTVSHVVHYWPLDRDSTSDRDLGRCIVFAVSHRMSLFYAT